MNGGILAAGGEPGNPVTSPEAAGQEDMEIEMVGICTDICVVSNAILLKARLPEVNVVVDAACCAGVTPETHNAALQVMQMCQVEIR